MGLSPQLWCLLVDSLMVHLTDTPSIVLGQDRDRVLLAVIRLTTALIRILTLNTHRNLLVLAVILVLVLILVLALFLSLYPVEWAVVITGGRPTPRRISPEQPEQERTIHVQAPQCMMLPTLFPEHKGQDLTVGHRALPLLALPARPLRVVPVLRVMPALRIVPFLRVGPLSASVPLRVVPVLRVVPPSFFTSFST
ncbi:hypothetical protein B0H14DRAFT_2755292, partial [Mycena olivaceomarginata]